MLQLEQKAIEGDRYSKMVLRALAYQVAKEIGGMATVLKGKIYALALTDVHP